MTRINENAPTALRRRLSHDNLKNDIQNILEYEINPNHYSNVGDFISDVCDWMVSNISDDMEYEHNIKIQYKDKDKLYHFLVNNFGEMIAEYYKKNKKENLKESIRRVLQEQHDVINSYDIKEALRIAFPYNWFPETDDLTAGLRNIHTIGEKIGVPEETWSIMNYFNTRAIPKMLNEKWESENKPNKIKWLVDVFTKDKYKDFFNSLLKRQWKSLSNGIETEINGINNLTQFLRDKNINFEYQTYPHGNKTDIKNSIDLTIIFPEHNKSKNIQIKPLGGLEKTKDGKIIVTTHGMKNDYKKQHGLDYILYNKDNKLVMFKNENYEVIDGGEKVIHNDNPKLEYTLNSVKLNEHSERKSKVEIFQDLINEKLEDIKNQCEDLLNDNFNVGFQSCDDIEIIDSIVVNEVEMMRAGRTDMYGNMHDVTSSVYIKLTINYSNIKDVNDFDDLTYDLKWMLKNSTGGLPIVFDYRTNNLNKIKE